MAPLKPGSSFPSGVIFEHVKIDGTIPRSAGMPQDYEASKLWADKKVALFSLPGAFTLACQGQHIGPITEKVGELKKKGVEIVAVIGYNDGWVMAAWGKINGVGDDQIVRRAFPNEE